MAGSRIQNTKRNFRTSLVLQIVKTALVLLNRIIFVRILGATFLGINGLFTNILTVLSIADLGMTPAMMYSLYKPLAEKNEQLVHAYVKAFKRIYNVIAAVILVLGVLLMPFLHYVVNLPSDIPNLYLYYILMLLNVVLSYLFVYKITLLQADQKSYIINRIDTFAQIALFVLQVIVLLVTKNFVLYLTSNIVVTLLSNFAKSLAANREHKYIIQDNKNKLPSKLRKELANNVGSLFLYKIGSAIQSNTDNILISIFVGTISVGYYSNYTAIILAITSFVNVIFSSIKASLGDYNLKESIEEQEKMFFVLEDYNYMLVGFCTICFMLLIPDFIKIAFGAEYILEPITLIFIVAGFYTSNIRQNIWMYRETTGMFNKTKFITITTSAINLVTSIIGGYFFGITGILAATVFSRMVYAWWKEPLVLFRKYFKSGAKRYFVQYITRVIYLGLVISAMSVMMQYIYVPNPYATFAIRAALVAVTAIILVALPLIKSDSLKFLKKIIRRSAA